MNYSQSEVWWGPAPHKSNSAYRPWLIINGDTHPFADKESIAIALTTQQHPAGIVVLEEDLQCEEYTLVAVVSIQRPDPSSLSAQRATLPCHLFSQYQHQMNEIRDLD